MGFRLTMSVVILLFAWRTYEEVAIAKARSSGNLERADATVVNRAEERDASPGGAGQDRSAEVYVRYEVTLVLRVNGELQTVKGGGDRVLEAGDRVQAGLWHGHVVELDGFYVWQLSAPPRQDLMRITVKALGGHSASVARLRPGTRVWAEGPYGSLTADRRTAHKSLLIAGGSASLTRRSTPTPSPS